ncbi:hypothetical protein [Peredibacter starrii]|uniref:Uncharacterized protein n=1 Tax=Peredibacter starrii TaxID=28202 RepID=A0AAX4HJQ9_9BACT|nr:hypothetical protein [Peredibacter starrii]WPU63472.1 hypothetical protein SOO65_12310 [Peredibacter starrii]
MTPQESIYRWFKILEEKGEYSHFTVIEKTESGEVLESEVFHGEMDGVGGFLSIMKERGESDLLIPELPVRNRPSSLFFAYSFFRYLMRLPFYSPGWKIQNQWNKKSEKPQAYAFTSLSVAETEKIWMNAKKLGVSRNAYLLHHLNLSLNPYIKESLLPRYWLIPVNLRTDFNHHLENITGFVDARITTGQSAQALDKNLKKSLSRGDFFGGHVGIGLGQFLGPHLLKLLVTMNDFIQVRTGVFTNLGNWKTKPGHTMKSHWFGLPPVIAAQPFGAMTGSMNGEQSLAVVFHPRLTLSKAVAEECLARWVKALLQY